LTIPNRFIFFSQDKSDVIESLRDILIQEIMTIENSEFEGEAIDMDTIAFASNLTALNFPWENILYYTQYLHKQLMFH